MIVSDSFEVNASFPADPKHRATLEALVVQAAECAGCSPDAARGLAEEAVAAFSAGVSTAGPRASVGVRLERRVDAIEVVVSSGATVRISRPLVVTP
jgi:hypothetical protein